MVENNSIKVLVTVMAVNIETKIPIAKVKANPLTEPEPNEYKTIQVIIEEKFESRIEGQALKKPSFIACTYSLPPLISSFIRSKINTLASRAIPIDKINPAIPAKLKVTGINLKIASEIIP